MPARKLTYTTRLKCSFGAVRSLVTGEVATLKARIESLQAELAKLEATAASHRADFERVGPTASIGWECVKNSLPGRAGGYCRTSRIERESFFNRD